MECANVLSGMPQENSAAAAAAMKNTSINTMQQGKQGFRSLLDLFACLLGAEGQNLEESKGTENSSEDSLGDTLENILQNNLITGENSELAGLLLNLQGSFPTGMDADLLRFVQENFVGFIQNKPQEGKLSGKISPQIGGVDTSNEMDLDKYKLLISRLLGELSGKITKLPAHNLAKNDLKFIHNLQSYFISNSTVKTAEIAENLGLDDNNLPSEIGAGGRKTINSFSQENTNAFKPANNLKEANAPVIKNDHTAAVQTEKSSQPKVSENENVISQYNQAVFKTSELPQHNTSKIDFQNIFTQISKEFKNNIPADSKEIKEFEVQLNPAELGKIKINLRLQDGQVHLNLKAYEPLTQANLQQNLSQLREQLEATGVSCGSLEMDFGRGGNSNWQQTKQPNIKNNFTEKTSQIDIGIDKNFSSIERHYDGGTRINFIA